MTFCLTVAKRYQLDPFQQQIWFLAGGILTIQRRLTSSVWTPQVAVNSLLLMLLASKNFGFLFRPDAGPMITVEFQKNGQGTRQKLKFQSGRASKHGRRIAIIQL